MKTATLILTIAVAVIAFAFVGCDNMNTGTTTGTTNTSAPASSAAVAKTGTELAKVGSSMITVEEFEEKLEKIPPFYKKKLATLEGKKEFLDRMVMEELYYQEAMNRKLDKDNEFLQQVESIKRNLLANKIKRELLEEDVTANDDEVKEYFDANKEEKFKVDESLKLRHILVRVSRKATDEDVAKAEAKAEEALAALKGGKPFAKVAEEYSEDKYSARKGGEIPAVRKGVKSAEFEEAAWALKKAGDRSGVFRDRRGFNILELIEQQPASYKEFDKVEGQIKRTLENEKRKSILDDFNAKLKTDATVTINEKLLAEVGPQLEEIESEDAAPAAQPKVEGEDEDEEQ